MGGQHHTLATLPLVTTQYLLCRRLGGLQGWCGQMRKILPPPGFDPQTIQPVVSRHTNYAILAHICSMYLYLNLSTIPDLKV